eukprot:gene3773-7490_t
MRILKQFVSEKDGAGSVQLHPNEPEDMWHLYNLISEGDRLSASTVVRESQTGSVEKTRTRMKLKIQIELIEFDSEQCSLRLKGKNIEENEYVKMGQYHTLELELDHPFWLEKDCWDAIYMDRLKESSDPARKAEVAAIVMQEGLAHICVLTTAMTVTKARIERTMPKKRQANNSHSKAVQKFFEDIYDSILRLLNFEMIKVVLLGSPGFLKDDFYKFMLETAERRGDVVLLHNKSKFLRSYVSSGFKNAVDELLSNSELKSQLADVKAADEVRALDSFYSTLASDQDRACYGFDSVLAADDQLAVQDLLVTDKLFRAADVKLRKRYVDLVESVKTHGGQVFVFSSMHVSGEQLDQYTGVAATLRFPLPEVLEEQQDEEEEEEEDTEEKRASSLVALDRNDFEFGASELRE